MFAITTADLKIFKYAKMIEQCYSSKQGTDYDKILKDTFVCGLFVPDSIITEKKKLLSLVVKHPDIPGVDLISNI